MGGSSQGCEHVEERLQSADEAEEPLGPMDHVKSALLEARIVVAACRFLDTTYID